jgi:hypothetical protein
MLADDAYPISADLLARALESLEFRIALAKGGKRRALIGARRYIEAAQVWQMRGDAAMTRQALRLMNEQLEIAETRKG